jgi:hypothetical protein
MTMTNAQAYAAALAIAAQANALAAGLAPAATSPPPPPPPPAQDAATTAHLAAGFSTNTFNTQAFTTTNVDMKQSGAKGFQWYNFNGFGYSPTPFLQTINADGTITNAGQSAGGGGLSTAWETYGVAPGAHGMAFGGGGYFEATFSFDPSQMTADASGNPIGGWPSFWALDVNHLLDHANNISTPRQGPEIDGFEYWAKGQWGWDGTKFAATLHGWQWPANTELFPQVQQGIPLPTGEAWTDFHRYGWLHIPATATTKGSITRFLDGVQVGTVVTWNQGDPLAVMDASPYFLIIEGGQTSPIKIKSVQVWQRDASKNLSA